MFFIFFNWICFQAKLLNFSSIIIIIIIMVGSYRIEIFYIFLQNKKKCQHVKKIVACFGASLPGSIWEASRGNYFSGTRIKKQFRLQARMFFIQKSGSLCKPTLIKTFLYNIYFWLMYWLSQKFHTRHYGQYPA